MKKAPLEVEGLILSGSISNELDYERALIADRSLRLLAKEDAHFKTLRSKLRALIALYEKAVWSDVDQIDEKKLLESDQAERQAELERQFIQNRKQLIRQKLQTFDLTQENLASLLGHQSKTHMSELINGIKPFTLKDLIIIHQLFQIEMAVLIPVFLSKDEQLKVKKAIKNLDKPQLKLTTDDFNFA